MAYQVIPLTPSPNQTFTTSLKVNGGKTLNFKFTFRFNELSRYWIMNIVDSTNNNPILSCIPLVPGDYPAGNLLAQYDYLKIGSAYLINNSDFVDEYPNAQDLGVDWVLVWSDNE